MVESSDIRLTKDYSSFDAIKKGDLICIENGREYVAQNDGFILFPRPKNPVGTEAYHLLTTK